MRSLNELTDYVLGNKPLPADATFTTEEVKDMINLKNAELAEIASNSIGVLANQIKETTDDRVTAETIEVINEYFDMLEEDLNFPEFANL